MPAGVAIRCEIDIQPCVDCLAMVPACREGVYRASPVSPPDYIERRCRPGTCYGEFLER